MWCNGVSERNLKCTGARCCVRLVYAPTEHKLQVLVSSLHERTEGDSTHATQMPSRYRSDFRCKDFPLTRTVSAPEQYATVAQCEERVEQRDQTLRRSLCESRHRPPSSEKGSRRGRQCASLRKATHCDSNVSLGGQFFWVLKLVVFF